MTSSVAFGSGFRTIAGILLAMAVVAAVEVAIPLRARGRWNREHLVPNLTLTFITFATNIGLNVAVVALVAWLESRRVGALHWLALPPLAAAAVAVAALDLAFYAAHVSWHKI